MNSIIIKPIIPAATTEAASTPTSTDTSTPKSTIITDIKIPEPKVQPIATAQEIDMSGSFNRYKTALTTEPPPKPSTPFYRGQRAVFETNELITPGDQDAATNYVVSFKPTPAGNIACYYKTDGTLDHGEILDIDEFCGQMTALVNVLLRNSLLEACTPGSTEDNLITITHAVKNLLQEDFDHTPEGDALVTRDFMLNEEEIKFDFPVEFKPEYYPAGLLDWDDYYTKTNLDYSGAVKDVDSDLSDEEAIAIRKVFKDNNHWAGYLDDDDVPIFWTPKSNALLEYDTIIDWYDASPSVDKTTLTYLPRTPEDLALDIKDFCTSLSDELFAFTDAYGPTVPLVKRLDSLNCSTLYLALLSFKDLESFVDTVDNLVDIGSGKYDYPEFRSSLAACILSFCNIDVCHPKLNKVFIDGTGYTLEDLCTEIEKCIDRAFYYGVLKFNDL